MITLDQTLYAIERIRDLLRSANQIEPNLRHTASNLKDLQSMIEMARKKSREDPKEFEAYVDRVLSPQLDSIVQALEAGTETQLKHLQTASDQLNSLIASLQMVTGGMDDSLFG